MCTKDPRGQFLLSLQKLRKLQSVLWSVFPSKGAFSFSIKSRNKINESSSGAAATKASWLTHLCHSRVTSTSSPLTYKLEWVKSTTQRCWWLNIALGPGDDISHSRCTISERSDYTTVGKVLKRLPWTQTCTSAHLGALPSLILTELNAKRCACQCTWHMCCCVIGVSVVVWKFTKFLTEPIDVIAKWQIFLPCSTLLFPPFLSWQFQTFPIKEPTLLFFSLKQSFSLACFIIDLGSLPFTLTSYSSPQVKAICLSITHFLVSEEAVSLPLGQTLIIIILVLTLDSQNAPVCIQKSCNASWLLALQTCISCSDSMAEDSVHSSCIFQGICSCCLVWRDQPGYQVSFFQAPFWDIRRTILNLPALLNPVTIFLAHRDARTHKPHSCPAALLY